uniref:Rab-GAP TBC domain-containing protein n=1 Tax=Macrostomum lignano TaxID=282301 RepID=A0A1I8HZG5_9PLAT
CTHRPRSGLAKLIEKAAHLLCQSQKQQKKAGFLPTEPAGPDAAAAVTADATSASRMDELGIRLMVEYGINLRLLSPEDNPAGRLRQLLRSVRDLLAKEQRRPRNELGLTGAYRGFDWFAAAVFLLFGGAQDRAWACLQNLAVLPASAYLWPHRMHN